MNDDLHTVQRNERIEAAHNRLMQNLEIARQSRSGELKGGGGYGYRANAHQIWAEIREDIELLSEGHGRDG